MNFKSIAEANSVEVTTKGKTPKPKYKLMSTDHFKPFGFPSKSWQYYYNKETKEVLYTPYLLSKNLSFPNVKQVDGKIESNNVPDSKFREAIAPYIEKQCGFKFTREELVPYPHKHQVSPVITEEQANIVFKILGYEVKNPKTNVRWIPPKGQRLSVSVLYALGHNDENIDSLTYDSVFSKKEQPKEETVEKQKPVITDYDADFEEKYNNADKVCEILDESDGTTNSRQTKLDLTSKPTLTIEKILEQRPDYSLSMAQKDDCVVMYIWSNIENRSITADIKVSTLEEAKLVSTLLTIAIGQYSTASLIHAGSLNT